MKGRIGCVVIGFLSLILSLSAQTASSSAASSQVPPLIQFSNVATDEGGSSLSGAVNLTFSLYAAQQGGEPLWTETQNNVQLDATGHYSVQLGVTKPSGVPTTLFTSGEARWLEVRVAEQAEQPRVLLLSVPYALKAGDAATIGGLPPSAFVLAAPGTVSASTTFVASSSASDTQAAIPAATDVTGLGTINFIPLWTSTSNIANSVLFQSAASPFRIGINTITPATTLDVKGAGTIRGVLALPATAVATAAKGANSQPLNLVASAFNSTTSTAVNQTFQWQAEPAANDTTSPSGTLNLLFGTGATKPAETGLHIAGNGQITFAAGQTFPGGGTITGVTTASTSGLTGGGTSGTLNLALTSACAKNQVLQWNGTAWACAAVGTGTVTSVATGAGLTGGPITGSGTLSIPTGGVTNSMLATSYAQLGVANTFTANQTVNGTLTANSSSSTVNGTSTGVNSPGVFGGGVGFGVIGTASSTSGMAVQGNATATSGTTVGVFGTATSPAGYGVEGYNAAATGGIGVYGFTGSPSGQGVQGFASATTGTTYGVNGISESPAGYGVVGQQLASTGTSAGVFGTTSSSSGYGVVGVQGSANPAPGSAGVAGSSSSGFGVSGASPIVAVLGTASGTGTGVLGEGLTGVVGSDTVGTGQGVLGKGQNIGVEGTSENVGVYGQSFGSSIAGTGISLGRGVWGDTGGAVGSYVAVLGTADENIAGAFLNNSPVSTLPTLYAENATTTPGGTLFLGFMPSLAAGGNPTALIGDSLCGAGFMSLQLGQEGMSGCNNYTLMGDLSGNTYLNAVTGGTVFLRINNQSALSAANGLVSVRGNFTATGTKNFRIDHPLDPANKYLSHAAMESSEVLNHYSGNAMLDASGEAIVQFPEWFEAINKDFRYQLTAIGAPGRDLYVAEEVSEGHFKIAGGKPGSKVSWQVEGVRNDAWEKAHPMEVEADKGADRGRYLTPELYGAPETAAIGYMAPAPGSENVVRHPLTLPRRRNVSPLQPQAPIGNAVPRMPLLPSVPKIPTLPGGAAAQPKATQPR